MGRHVAEHVNPDQGKVSDRPAFFAFKGDHYATPSPATLEEAKGTPFADGTPDGMAL